MTHDELLSKINKWEYSDYQAIGMISEWPYKALRAILELHKPDWVQYDDGSGCLCNNAYPCATIEAIEKELA